MRQREKNIDIQRNTRVGLVCQFTSNGEGAGTIWQVDKLDTDAVIMANIKQDEFCVDLLFDGTASFYLALA